MADKEELLRLAERCEAATGPDRELDCAILAALDWREDDWEPGEKTVRKMVAKRGLREFAKSADGGLSIWRWLLRITASLDAAMTLVPEGWSYSAYQGPSGRPHKWELRSIRDGETKYTEREGKAATPALALCAAALKARALSTERGEGGVSDEKYLRDMVAEWRRIKAVFVQGAVIIGGALGFLLAAWIV